MHPEIVEIRDYLSKLSENYEVLRRGQEQIREDLASFKAEVLQRFDRLERRVSALELKVAQLQQAVLENRRAIEENRKAIEENRKAIEENRKAIEENRKAIEENRKAIEENRKAIAGLQVDVRDIRRSLDRTRSDRNVDEQRIQRLELRVHTLEERLGLAD